MSIFNKRAEILRYIEDNRDVLLYNEQIFKILEGRLIELVDASLQQQLSPDSYKTAIERVSPINVLRKTINKRSTLYTDEVQRETVEEKDQELIAYYEQNAAIDSYFEDANKGFNAYKNTVLEFYIDNGIVKTRNLPSTQFLPYSDDPVNPLRVTAMIKFMGVYKKNGENEVEKYWVYTDDEFMAIDSDGELVNEDMEENEGLNSFGVIPFVYINKSRALLVPFPDKDDLAISILVPVLLTDLNFAAKFLAHSVFYGIDIDVDNMKLSPDAVWIFKSDRDGNKPEVGTIKPEVSIEDVLMLAREQLNAWLDTKNIKASTMGKTDDASASGIAKIIDEADITLDRKQQIRVFREAEVEYWQTLAKIHNEAAQAREISNTALFSSTDLTVNVEYSEQKVLEARVDVVDRLIKEVSAGFRSARSAVVELNPKASPEEIDEMMEEIAPKIDFGGEIAGNEQED